MSHSCPSAQGHGPDPCAVPCHTMGQSSARAGQGCPRGICQSTLRRAAWKKLLCRAGTGSCPSLCAPCSHPCWVPHTKRWLWAQQAPGTRGCREAVGAGASMPAPQWVRGIGTADPRTWHRRAPEQPQRPASSCPTCGSGSISSSGEKHLLPINGLINSPQRPLNYSSRATEKTITALTSALAQPVQQPARGQGWRQAGHGPGRPGTAPGTETCPASPSCAHTAGTAPWSSGEGLPSRHSHPAPSHRWKRCSPRVPTRAAPGTWAQERGDLPSPPHRSLPQGTSHRSDPNLPTRSQSLCVPSTEDTAAVCPLPPTRLQWSPLPTVVKAAWLPSTPLPRDTHLRAMARPSHRHPASRLPVTPAPRSTLLLLDRGQAGPVLPGDPVPCCPSARSPRGQAVLGFPWERGFFPQTVPRLLVPWDAPAAPRRG